MTPQQTTLKPSQPRFRPSDAVDFVVIGAGAAGGIMAKELASAGFSVVVLEQGPYMREAEFRHDEIGNTFLGALVNDHKRQPNTFRTSAHETAKLKPTLTYGRMVGGGTVHFTANYWRFHDIDFEERSRWGAIEGTGFADWPIRYRDLEPYYTQAEEELGVSGLAGASPFDPWRSKPYPLPPLPVKSSGVLFERAARKFGWHPFPAPMAILSQPYRGRGACLHCGFCEGFGCEVRAKSSTLATVIPEAEKTGRCEIRTESYVRKIEISQRGKVTGAIYFDAGRREIFQRAKAVIVCANGAETPRLLLMSKSNRFPQGLANSCGLVGKYLMLDSGSFSGGLFEFPLNEYKSVQVTRVLHDFYDSDPKRGFYGGGGIDARFDFYPISFALSGLPKDVARWGPEFKRTLREYYTRCMFLLSHSTSLAVETNSISLDPQLKDDWGLPALRITYQSHPDDLKTMQFLLERELELLDAAGARKTWAFPVESLTEGVHLLGTCRMGNDPQNSVVDAYHRAHDVPNLFLVDGSSFVTAGRNQPTCTIQALAYRAADHIKKAARAGSF
jgi:choline dehydrogenase-like flavoprotein